MLLENWCSLGALLVCFVCSLLLVYESLWGPILDGKSRSFQPTTFKYHRDNLLCVLFHGTEIHLIINVLSLTVLSLFQDELVFLVRFFVYSWFGVYVITIYFKTNYCRGFSAGGYGLGVDATYLLTKYVVITYPHRVTEYLLVAHTSLLFLLIMLAELSIWVDIRQVFWSFRVLYTGVLGIYFNSKPADLAHHSGRFLSYHMVIVRMLNDHVFHLPQGACFFGEGLVAIFWFFVLFKRRVEPLDLRPGRGRVHDEHESLVH